MNKTFKFNLGRFPVPTQHGAWAFWLIPAFMGLALSGTWRWSTLLVVLGFLLIFLSHQPTIRALRKWYFRKQHDINSISWALLLSGSGLILLAVLFIINRLWLAILLGFFVSIAFTFHIILTLKKEHLSIPGEIIGVFGLTAAAPLIYLYLHGILDAVGWVLWAINFLYFTGSVFYVKLRLRIQPTQPERNIIGKISTGAPLLLYALGVLIFMVSVTFLRNYSWLFFTAFVPFFIKVLWGVYNWQRKVKLKPSRLGFSELAHSICFGCISILGFFTSGI